VKVGGKVQGLFLDGSDVKFALGTLPSSGGTACLDFSKGAWPKAPI
jgi:hypothetical protein